MNLYNFRKKNKPLSTASNRRKIALNNNFDRSSALFDAHIQIFQYLNLKDLTQVRKVSRMWNFLSTHPLLWTRVNMEGVTVKNWKAFFNLITQKNIQSLDLSKMDFPDDLHADDIWSEFTQAISEAQTVRKLKLRSCPSDVVDAIIERCPQIQMLNISDCPFLISKDYFKKQQNL